MFFYIFGNYITIFTTNYYIICVFYKFFRVFIITTNSGIPLFAGTVVNP